MIYPIPQKNNLNGESLNISSVCVSGDYSEIAEKMLNISKNGFPVEISVSNSKKITYIDEVPRLSDEKYFVTVAKDKAVVEASSKRGVFRALNTLAKLIENNELKVGTLEDYPLFEKRGYIEGFYGPTWEHNTRLSVMALAAKYGMNTYYYAPKDDLYHREKWRELYPEKEMGELKVLFDCATENEFDFFWCIGPGLSYKYTSENDFDLLIAKIKSVYDVAVKNFGLLLDDIPWDFQYEDDEKAFDGIVDAHIELVNKTYRALKNIDEDINLTVCPTQYSGDENGYYASKFGNGIPADVSMFWTGAEICSRVLTVREADALLRYTKHQPLYWDNYPVNDCEMFQEMHLGAVIGREKELYKHCEGLISNAMEYAECSKIPILTVADYLWNPLEYNPENSLRNAYEELLGDRAELFAYFGDNLGVSCLSRYSGGIMSRTLAEINSLWNKGECEKSAEKFKAYNSKMRECLAMLRDTSVPLFNELKKWVDKYSMCCDLLDAILKMRLEPSEKNKNDLAQQLESYNMNAVLLTGFSLRETAEKTLRSF